MCVLFSPSAESTAHMSHDGHSYAWLLPRAVKRVLVGGQVQPARSWRNVAAPIVMSGGLAQEPPWPNGQGVGPLIRRLQVRVPQGVLGADGKPEDGGICRTLCRSSRLMADASAPLA